MTDPFFQMMMNLLVQPISQNGQLQPGEGETALEAVLLPGTDVSLVTADMLQVRADGGQTAGQPALFAAEVLNAAIQLAEPGAQQDTMMSSPDLQAQSARMPQQTAAPAADGKVLEAFRRVSQQTQPAAQMPARAEESQVMSQLQALSAEVLSEDALTAQRDFSQAVSRARQLLEASGETVPEEIQAAQQPMKAETALPFEAEVREVQNPEQPHAPEEIPMGIKQNLALGKKEFTLRLRPESLGEITVRLIEEGGKTTLQLTAASANTAKLINQDIDTLRETMAPLNVEVRYAVASTQDAQGAGLQQMDLSSQQFMHHRFARQQSFSSGMPAGMQGQELAGGVIQMSQAVTGTAYLSNRLDAYV